MSLLASVLDFIKRDQALASVDKLKDPRLRHGLGWQIQGPPTSGLASADKLKEPRPQADKAVCQWTKPINIILLLLVYHLILWIILLWSCPSINKHFLSLNSPKSVQNTQLVNWSDRMFSYFVLLTSQGSKH